MIAALFWMLVGIAFGYQIGNAIRKLWCGTLLRWIDWVAVLGFFPLVWWLTP